ncbi:MAG: FAD-dependent monooxygenase [Hyphomicrobiales bacterium]|nr:FAD-dependent monooxygenase [Hyphomicrobiales bacterium]
MRAFVAKRRLVKLDLDELLSVTVLAAAAATPRLRMRVNDIEQREDQVLTKAIDLDGNAMKTTAARYVVGCDGAHS